MNWPRDQRGWMGAALYSLVVIILAALILNPELASVKLFEFLAQGIVIQGFLQLAGAYYFTASKSGVELAERNAGIVEANATASNLVTSPASAASEPSEGGVSS